MAELVEHGWIWLYISGMAVYDQKLLEITENDWNDCKLLDLAVNGCKWLDWLEMAENSCKWLYMTLYMALNCLKRL